MTHLATLLKLAKFSVTERTAEEERIKEHKKPLKTEKPARPKFFKSFSDRTHRVQSYNM